MASTLEAGKEEPEKVSRPIRYLWPVEANVASAAGLLQGCRNELISLPKLPPTAQDTS